MDTSKARWVVSHKSNIRILHLKIGGKFAQILATITPVPNSEPKLYRWFLSETPFEQHIADSEYAAQRAVRRALRETNDG